MEDGEQDSYKTERNLERLLMIINYDRNPALAVDQKLQSLMDSIQMALDELNTRIDKESSEIKSEMIIDPKVISLYKSLGWIED